MRNDVKPDKGHARWREGLATGICLQPRNVDRIGGLTEKRGSPNREAEQAEGRAVQKAYPFGADNGEISGELTAELAVEDKSCTWTAEKSYRRTLDDYLPPITIWIVN